MSVANPASPSNALPVSTWAAAKRAFAILRRHPFAFIVLQIPILLTEILFRQVTPPIKNIESVSLKLLFASLLWVAMYGSNYLVQCFSVQAIYSVRKTGRVELKMILDFTLQRIAPLFISSVAIGLVVLVGMLAFVLPGLILFAIYLYVPGFIIVTKDAPLPTIFRRSFAFTRAHALGTLGVVAIFAVAFGISFGVEDGLETLSELYVNRVPRILFDAFDICFSVGLGMCLHAWVAEYFIEGIGNTGERKS